jgi:hypothetical protein
VTLSPRRRRFHTSLWSVVVAAALACGAFAVPSIRLAAADKWPDVDPAELKLAASRVEPNADAEVLLWDVRVTDEVDNNDEIGTVMDHYLRIKIFTERGRDTESRVDIPYRDDARIRNIEGRSVAPDGKIAELRGADVFDRTIVAIGGMRLKARSFVLPAVVPGSIVEYRWREIHEESFSHYVELPFQREIPIQTVRYHIKPLEVGNIGLRMRTQLFNMTRQPEVSNESKGYTQIQVRNVPALRREPYMPAELAAKSWILLFYEPTKLAELPASQFWGVYASDVYEDYQNRTKITNDIKKVVKEAVPAGATPEQTVNALVQYVRARVKPPAAGVPFKLNKNATEALARGVGIDDDRIMAFAALATAAGLETRIVSAGDRSTNVVDPNMKQPYFFAKLVASVKVGERWRYVDAGNPHAPDGQLRWEQEGVPVFLVGDKNYLQSTSPTTPPTFSKQTHTGTVKLLDNGTLEGDLTAQYTGHLAVDRREEAIDQSPDQRRDTFQKALAERLPGATVTQFAIENLDKPDLPYIVKFHLTVPRYTERTGSRTFVQPAVMQRGFEAVFTSASRQHKVVFPFNWTEEDDLTLELPAGYTLEAGTPPAPAKGGLGVYGVQVQPTADGKQVKFLRRLSVGVPGRNTFTPTDYPAIKNFFDAVHRGDSYTLTLRGAGAP